MGTSRCQPIGDWRKCQHLTLWSEPFSPQSLLFSVLLLRSIETETHRIKHVHPHVVQGNLYPSTLSFIDILRSLWLCPMADPYPEHHCQPFLFSGLQSSPKQGSFPFLPICNISGNDMKITHNLPGKAPQRSSQKSVAASLNQDCVLRMVLHH